MPKSMRNWGKILLIVLLCFPDLSSGRQKPAVVVAFGNSVTAPRKGVEKVYPARLLEKLDEAGISCKVINSGVGSSHTGSVTDNSFARVRHGMDRFQEDVLNHGPGWVIINFGLNDAYQDGGFDSEPRIPLESYRNNLHYFIKKIREQGGRVILLTPNPLGSKYEWFRYRQVEKYAGCMREVAREQKVALVDSWELFYRSAQNRRTPGNIDFLFLDGIHPNDQGHELIADAIFRIIRKKRF